MLQHRQQPLRGVATKLTMFTPGVYPSTNQELHLHGRYRYTDVRFGRRTQLRLFCEHLSKADKEPLVVTFCSCGYYRHHIAVVERITGRVGHLIEQGIGLKMLLRVTSLRSQTSFSPPLCRPGNCHTSRCLIYASTDCGEFFFLYRWSRHSECSNSFLAPSFKKSRFPLHFHWVALSLWRPYFIAKDHNGCRNCKIRRLESTYRFGSTSADDRQANVEVHRPGPVFQVPYLNLSPVTSKPASRGRIKTGHSEAGIS